MDARIISGIGNEGTDEEGAHAWNIVCLNNYYYNVDATWDSVTENHRKYFLKGDYNFSFDHCEDEEYDYVFYNFYPVNSNDYNPVLPDDGPPQSKEHEGSCGTNLSYSFDEENGCLTITGTGDMTDYNHYYLEYAPWYGFRGEIKEVRIEEGVTSVGDWTFVNCFSLESVSLPSSVKVIGSNAFAYCDSIKKISLPSGLTTIKNRAFFGCENLSLASGTLPSRLSVIEEDAFYCCKMEGTITLPASLTTINRGVFYNNDMTKLVINGAVESIGERAFYGCENLETITINGSISRIEEYAFRNAGITELNIPQGLVFIGGEAFEDTPLQKITLPEELETIGDFAFTGCAELNELMLPASVTSVGLQAFPQIETLVIDEGNRSFSTENGILYNYDKTEILFAFCHRTQKILKIRDGVKKIDDYAFVDEEGIVNNVDMEYAIRTLSIPDSVEEIGIYAFSRMHDLETIYFGKELKKIGESAFYNIRTLAEVHFSGALPEIADNAFENDISICYYPENWEEDSIPPADGFGGYFYWTREGESRDSLSGTCGENVTWNLEADGTIYIRGIGAMEDYTTSLQGYGPWYAFRNKIRKVVVEDGVTTVGACAFADCDKLKEVYIAETVEELCSGAFKYCPWIEYVDLKEGLTTIGNSAFQNSLRKGMSIILPSTVTYIGDAAFSVFGSIYNIQIYFKGSLPELGEMALANQNVVYYPDSWDSVPDIPDEYIGLWGYEKQNPAALYQVGKPVTLTAPVQKELRNTPKGIFLSWNAVQGAKGYVIYRYKSIGKLRILIVLFRFIKHPLHKLSIWTLM